MIGCTRLAVLLAVLVPAHVECCKAAAAANAARQLQQQQWMQQGDGAEALFTAAAQAEQQWRQQKQQEQQQPYQQQQTLQHRKLLQPTADLDQVDPDQADAAAPIEPLDPTTTVAGGTLASTVGNTGDPDSVPTSTVEQAVPSDQAGPNSDEADLPDAIAELLDSSTSQDPKPYGNRAPDPSDMPSHQGRKRCGTQPGSYEQQAAAEQRFQTRLQVPAAAANSKGAAEADAADSDDGVKAAAAGTVADIKVFFHVLQYKQPLNKTQGVYRVLGYVSQARIDRQMRVLNAAYGVQFSFTLRKVQWYTTSRGYLFTAGQSSATERQVKTSICARAGNGAASVLNIYTWQPDEDVLGWATMPDWFVDTPDRDGVVLLHSVITGGGDPSYNQGDTLVHEVGHWLGLYHTFQGGCSKNAANGGDFVADTPAVASPNFKCVRVDSCPNLPGVDLVSNYMDYTDDRCINSFTPGQKQRMVQQWRAYRAR